MKNTTISIDEHTLEEARRYAERLGHSFNSWVNKIIRDAVRRSPQHAMKDLMGLAEKIAGDSRGKKWTREDVYER